MAKRADGRPTVTRQVAAAISLAASAASLVVVLGALIRHPLQLVLAVLLLGSVLGAGWAALVRRGFARAAAATAGIAAAVLLGLLPGLHAYALLATAAGLVALSFAAARTALGHDLARTPRIRRAEPASAGVLLLNPLSGHGVATASRLGERARALGIRPIELHVDDDLRELAEQAVADGADMLGMAGGDGSQAVVADVARRHDLPFVCVPAGTRNHFARDLGLDRDAPAEALAAFGEAVERRVDLGVAGGRVFVNNVSLGAYAALVRAPGYREAKAATIAGCLPDLFGPDARRPLRFPGPDGDPAAAADIVLVSNGPYRLERLTGLGRRERLDLGVLGIVTVAVGRVRDVPELVAAELCGDIARFPGYRAWSTPEFAVESADPLIDVAVDGEPQRLPSPLRIGVLPGVLRVRLPPDAPGTSPAAMAPKGVRRALRALLRVLAGRSARGCPPSVPRRSVSNSGPVKGDRR
ncbi:diacylglycerol kinase family protein [Amycolatopsis sp. Hca4]|uniref:diacylglycerol/lipid kinase family protein n=1 Tax=Amycolatopsis sp. Hca4 TaxID=2742131 RepID=UPI0015917C7D|nr:diacylglycerol kinase family protein [Amycolatopsis sp. Hca4]QKV80440.1 diacylglycerol kinase [Amycolatopsis sp. Hca4]